MHRLKILGTTSEEGPMEYNQNKYKNYTICIHRKIVHIYII